jgi:hypothetical protein
MSLPSKSGLPSASSLPGRSRWFRPNVAVLLRTLVSVLIFAWISARSLPQQLDRGMDATLGFLLLFAAMVVVQSWPSFRFVRISPEGITLYSLSGVAHRAWEELTAIHHLSPRQGWGAAGYPLDSGRGALLLPAGLLEEDELLTQIAGATNGRVQLGNPLDAASCEAETVTIRVTVVARVAMIAMPLWLASTLLLLRFPVSLPVWPAYLLVAFLLTSFVYTILRIPFRIDLGRNQVHLRGIAWQRVHDVATMRIDLSRSGFLDGSIRLRFGKHQTALQSMLHGIDIAQAARMLKLMYPKATQSPRGRNALSSLGILSADSVPRDARS